MQNLEIERKYKINFLPELSMLEKKEILQHYLTRTQDGVTRKRKITDKDGVKYIHTYKSHKGVAKGALVEIEKEITEEEYNSLGEGYGNAIAKTRYLYPLENNLVAEIDIFSGVHAGICIVEVEFPSIEEAKSFVKPDWFGKEINKVLDCGIRWSNAKLASMSAEEIAKVREELKIK